jgi:urocanate hydratase
MWRLHLASEPASATSDRLQLDACALYCALVRYAASASSGGYEREQTLGGKLLYAGELDSRGRAMVIAGNVSGCATLAATAELTAQKLVIRDGVVDFVVTSLDEALRILKNEVRKRATVAVCVGAAPAAVELEMIERGVLPDLMFEGSAGERRDVPEFGTEFGSGSGSGFGFGSRRVEFTAPDADLAFVTWQAAQAAARWMPRLDAIAMNCLSADWRAQRWIRLSPLYCGRSAQARRVVYCALDAARQIISRFEAHVQAGEIGTEVSAGLAIGGETEAFRFMPVTP